MAVREIKSFHENTQSVEVDLVASIKHWLACCRTSVFSLVFF